MAEKRMISTKICSSDEFCDMPHSAQALYLHLNLEADDDGFVNNPRKTQRSIEASADDLKLLIEKRYLICFENGVIAIKHWRMHNTIRKDRYTPTAYQKQFEMLEIKENGVYTEKKDLGNQVATKRQPDGNQTATQIRLDKISIDKYKYIVDYLNKKAGTNYKASTKKTKTCIHARLEEGFTEDDFITVIDKKCADWLGTEWEKFLRPETLFGTKFESYLNAKVTKKQNKGVPEGSEQDDLDDLF